MPNPSALTVTDLSANSSVNQPTTQAIDTNGAVPFAGDAGTERVIIEVTNAAAAALTVKVKAGAEAAGAIRSASGDLAVSLAASGSAGDKKIFGPFESARFVQATGGLNVEFTAASGAPNAAVRVYRLPRAI